jgi:hypothetical protein
MKVEVMEIWPLLHTEIGDDSRPSVHARAHGLIEALYPDIAYNGAQTRMVFNALVWGPVARLYPMLVKDGVKPVEAMLELQKKTGDGSHIDIPTEKLKGHEWMNRLPQLGL